MASSSGWSTLPAWQRRFTPRRELPRLERQRRRPSRVRRRTRTARGRRGSPTSGRDARRRVSGEPVGVEADGRARRTRRVVAGRHRGRARATGWRRRSRAGSRALGPDVPRAGRRDLVRGTGEWRSGSSQRTNTGDRRGAGLGPTAHPGAARDPMGVGRLNRRDRRALGRRPFDLPPTRGNRRHRPPRVAGAGPPTGETVGELVDGGRNLDPPRGAPAPATIGLLFTSASSATFERPAIWEPRAEQRHDLHVDLPGAAIPSGGGPAAHRSWSVTSSRARSALHRLDPEAATTTLIADARGRSPGQRSGPDGAVWFLTSDSVHPVPRRERRTGDVVLACPATRTPRRPPYARSGSTTRTVSGSRRSSSHHPATVRSRPS